MHSLLSKQKVNSFVDALASALDFEEGFASSLLVVFCLKDLKSGVARGRPRHFDATLAVSANALRYTMPELSW